MKAYQVREMKTEDLKIALQDNHEALQNVRFQHATGQLENYKSLSNLKKDIARMKTMLRERELNINQKVAEKVKHTKEKVKKVRTKKEKVTEAESETTE